MFQADNTAITQKVIQKGHHPYMFGAGLHWKFTKISMNQSKWFNPCEVEGGNGRSVALPREHPRQGHREGGTSSFGIPET